MKSRRFLLTLSLAACVAMLCAVAFRHQQVVHLRAEQQQKLANAAIAADPAPVSPVTASQSVSREVLQLRNQVAQLRRRRDELLPVRAEHEQLVLQLSARGKNASALPPNYIRKADARLVGYDSPEATLQSFLYAIRNHDLTNFFQAFTPEGAARLKSQGPQFLEKTLADSQALIGLSILGREQPQQDFIEANVQILPGLPPTPIYFRLINNQWKMDSLP
jgi:hypothetical protein